MAFRRPILDDFQRGSTPQLGSDGAFPQHVQQLVQHRVRERNVLRLWHLGTSQRSPVVRGVLGHLWAKPDRRSEPIRALSLSERHANQIQRSGRKEALQDNLLATLEPHDRALEADLARADRQERLGVGARDLRALLQTPDRFWHENKIRMARLDADEVLQVRARREIALNNPLRDAGFLSDEPGESRGNEKATLAHAAELQAN